MLSIYLREPCNEPARHRTAETLARRMVAPAPDPAALARDRERAAEHLGRSIARLTVALAQRGASVTRAPSAAAAAQRIATLAAAATVAHTRAAVIGELYPALRSGGVRLLPTYGPGRAAFDGRRQRFWQLPPHERTANWCARPIVNWSEDRRDVVGLLGVNAVSAETGAVYLLQHSTNMSDLLGAARLLIFVVGVDKIASDDVAAARQVEAVGIHGADSVLLDLARTQPLGDPLKRFPRVSGMPAVEVILLDNGRTALLGNAYRSLFACIGCRACATRCPTYPAFRGPRGWSPKDYLWSHLCEDNPSLDLCTFCGNCEVDCPVDIPLPTLIAQRRAEAIAARGRGIGGWRRRVQGDVQRLSKAFVAAAPLSNQAAQLPLAAPVMEKVFGLATERPLPTFRRETFERWFASRAGGPSARKGSRHGGCDGPAGRGGSRVVYYVGCFANYNNPEVGEATVATLNALGYQVALPEWRCCGIPLYAKGEIAAARGLAATNIAALAAYVNTGHEVITTCPSCQLALTRDYPRLFPSPAAERVAEHTHFLSRFLCAVGGLDGELGAVSGRAAYHLPCHLRALGMDGDSPRMLASVPGLSVTSISRGCCGLSGTFGLERAHYAQSMDIGSGVCAAIHDGDFDFVLTDCGACKMQIEHGTRRHVTHPVEIVMRAARVAGEPGSARPGQAGIAAPEVRAGGSAA